ncbi:NADH-quinone oxidoreductase subunit M [Chitinivorax sp. B]|uniref:NADH-quinone oxidoreductase subunit M n=1 Tax=Chitinivorax sp. B TaxID=2502235 RepID=UPI0010F46476|nr:NADH-quinone oxidoreductase subunit M [Chitinivorax sp. B]
MSEHLLSLAIWTPILAGVLVLATGSDRNAGLARWIALLGALAGFVVSLPLYTGFQSLHGGMQFEELKPWIDRFNINYHLGVDGISMLFVVLNSFTTLLVVVAGWEVIERRVAQYFAAFLIMSGLINGTFAALDAVLFYVFFEAMLIPMYLVIGVWGGPRRVYAAVKFFLYTLLGSLLMLVAFVYLYIQSGHSFNIMDYHALRLPLDVQKWLFFAFFMSFAVKVPMWPVHTWLPDAHVEAPTGGSMVLAAITLKIGAYGFLRFSLPIAPDAAHAVSGIMIFLSLVGVVYIGLVALIQSDMKKLVAYSSISHMGFVTLGLFMFAGGYLTNEGVEGALIQMLSHGFVSAAMFACIGVMYDRMHSRQIADYGGVVNTMPKFAAFMMLFAMANAGLPATSGFVGEFLVIMGAVKTNFWYAFLASTTLIFGAAYTLWMYKRVIFGDVANEHVAQLKDINTREFVLLGILAITVLGMGLYPEMFISKMHMSVNDLIAHVARSKI